MTTMTIKSVDRADSKLILVTDYGYESQVKNVATKASHPILGAFYKILMSQDEE